MKKINIAIFLAFAIISFNTSSMETALSLTKNGFSALCSGIELLANINEINNTYRNHRNILAKAQEQIYSDAPEIIIAYIKGLAQERNIKDIEIITLDSNEFADYWCNTPKRMLYVPTLYIEELEALLQKNTLTETEQKRLYYHIGSIHHELTHLKYNDGTYTHIYENLIGIPSSFFIIYGINTILTKKFPILSTNYIMNNVAKIIRSLAIIELTRYIVAMNLYSKYKEQRADNEIPNEKELLEIQLEAFQSYHQSDLEDIENIKSRSWKEIFEHLTQQDSKLLKFLNISIMKIIPIHWFNNSLIMNILYRSAEHPSHIYRAERFRKRIAELSKK